MIEVVRLIVGASRLDNLLPMATVAISYVSGLCGIFSACESGETAATAIVINFHNGRTPLPLQFHQVECSQKSITQKPAERDATAAPSAVMTI